MSKRAWRHGVNRRDFLRVGALGGLGITLADYLAWAKAGQATPAPAKAALLVYLAGGPSHMDTFDLKPDAPTELRGEFRPIPTNVPGVAISEHLPKLAQQADKFTVLRGVSHSLAAHPFGTKYMLTGNRPLPSLEFPTYGSVVSKELPCEPDLPPFVATPNMPQGAGYLGIAYNPFTTNATPVAGKPFIVRGVALGGGVTIDQLEKRQHLLEDLDATFDGFEQDGLVNGLDQFSEQAHAIIRSKRAREAFDVSKESPETASQFGDKPFGQSCLLACRLIEAGVRFVTVTFGGWDTHAQNFDRLKSSQLPQLDAGLAALFATLSARGLLASTTVMVTGEFGRTPKINPNAGRDHWPRAMFVLMGGGGVRGAQVLGASDEKGMGPAKNAITPDDIAATLYQSLGIDVRKEYHTPTGRPVMIVRNGTAIPELMG